MLRYGNTTRYGRKGAVIAREAVVVQWRVRSPRMGRCILGGYAQRTLDGDGCTLGYLGNQ